MPCRPIPTPNPTTTHTHTHAHTSHPPIAHVAAGGCQHDPQPRKHRTQHEGGLDPAGETAAASAVLCEDDQELADGNRRLRRAVLRQGGSAPPAGRCCTGTTAPDRGRHDAGYWR